MPAQVFALYELDGHPTREAVIEGLAAVPERLRGLLEDADAATFDRTFDPGQWSPFETLCHLRDAGLVYGMRFRWMVLDADPFLPNYDENAWVRQAVESVGDIPAMLDEFAAHRSELVRLLERAPAAAWERTGRHEVLGRLTLEPYVRHQLAHELGHIAQLSAGIAAARGRR